MIYIIDHQVKAFASGHRTSSMAAMMIPITQAIEENDLYNVALYLQNADMDTASILAPIKGFKLPDSGQIQDATTTPDEDSDFGKNPKSYTSKGKLIIDHNIQLMWPKDVAPGKTLSQTQNYCNDLDFPALTR